MPTQLICPICTVTPMQTEETRQLRVWWIPQVPGKRFVVPVGSLREGRLLLDTLARYDTFQYEQHIKPDYCNVGGLNVLEDGEWEDWYDEDGEDIRHPRYAREHA